MNRFYRGLRRGLSKAEALRQARLETRKQPGFESPYFWAPFILVGRGEDEVAFPPSSAGRTVATVASIVILLLLLAGRLRGAALRRGRR